METIIFRNQEFRIKEIDLPSFGEVIISTNKLSSLLFNDEDKYVNKEAELIDDEIFYYVEENEIGLSDFELIPLIEKDVKQ